MIEADSLIEKIDEIILKNEGLSYNGKKFFGDLGFQFHNGFRKEIYKVNQTISKEKNSRLEGDKDALGKRM